MADPSQETVEIQDALGALRLRPTSESTRTKVDICGLSDRGLRRERNEDHFLVARYGRFLDALYTNLPDGDVDQRLSEIGFGMVVADGLGGHPAGDQASRMAINTLVNLTLETSDWVLRIDSEQDLERVLRRARERFEQISRTMTSAADSHPELWGFGTTMTLAITLGRDAMIAHVGDSRAYLFRDGLLRQLTSDHTRVQELIDAGLIDHDRAESLKLRRCLTRILGDSVSRYQPSLQTARLRTGDVLLLCSDGLNKMVDDASIGQVMAQRADAETTCRRLIKMALEAGGADNITVIVAEYQFPDGH
jgi:protein phosphatase